MFEKENNILLNFTFGIFLTIIFFYLLIIGQEIIVPIIISILLAFSILGLSNVYHKIKIPKFFSFIFSIFTYFLIFFIMGKIISDNVGVLIEKLPLYQERISSLLSNLFSYFGLKEHENIDYFISKIDLKSSFTTLFNGITTAFSNIGMIIIYTIFILIEATNFREKLETIFHDNPQKLSIFETIKKIKEDVKSYFFIKVMVSLFTGFITYIIVLFFGLNFPAFWGLLAFILNFIPNIGSILAVFFPSILSFVQPGFDLDIAIFMILFLTCLQLIMGNIVEPKFMGNRLNLSPLVIIIALVFWGQIWGIIGMLLSVPIMVIINIILSRIKSTRPIATILSEKGELQMSVIEKTKKKKKFFL